MSTLLQVSALVNSPGQIAIIGEWRDETANADDSTVRKQLGHLCHSTNILLTISLTEPEVLIQARANVITIQAIRRNATGDEERLQLERNGCLAGTGKARQPDGASSEATTQAQVLATQRSRHMMLLFGNIGGDLQALKRKGV